MRHLFTLLGPNGRGKMAPPRSRPLSGAMRYRQVGRSGLTVSVLGLGTRIFGRECDQGQARAVVDAALDLGITFFDTAHSYAEGESERYLGEALKGKRGRAVISTKFGSLRLRRPDVAAGSRRHIREAVEDGLRRLQTDHIDLYQIHHPDPLTPIEETLSALEELVREGKVRYFGSSNLAAWQIVEAEWAARSTHGSRFISVQREYNLLDRRIEADVVPVCTKYGIGLFPYRPLGAGVLTGKYRRGSATPAGSSAPALTESTFVTLEAVERFARERGVGLLDVAIGGLAALPAVASVMAGARTPDQVRANASAAEWIPTAADLQALDIASGTAVESGTYARSAPH
jgi:aryl-alcohol dehydrogenase-like predicted oxidoreductase